MPASPVGRFVHRLTTQAAPDGELVRRFADARCEAAFAELVRRHGPAVFGVCRRALGDHHLAEDAFQAVFVVLARKAHAIRPPAAVGGWLFGVARKAAAEAAAMHRRKRRERLPGALPDRPAAAPEPDDTAAVVDAEIAALPAALLAAVLLCEIEGVPRARAAERLGVAEGTLSSRLARARKLLADRLRRRGVVAPAAGGVAALPAALAAAAVARADGRAAGAVLELSNGVLRTMLVSNLRLTPVVVLCVAFAVGGALMAVAPETPAAPRPAPRANAPILERKPEWKLLFTLGHSDPVSAVAIGREMIATGGERLRLWEAADGKELNLQFRGSQFPAPIGTLRFTPDDAYLVMVIPYMMESTPTAAVLRYRRSPAGLATDIFDGSNVVALSADLSTLAARESAWPARAGRPGRVPRLDRLLLRGDPWADPKNRLINPKAVFDYPGGHAITHADLSADGRRLAAAGDDAAVRIYDAATLLELHAISLKPGQKLTALALTGDGGRLVAVGEAGFAAVFDTAGKAKPVELRGHTGPVTTVAFAPDGRRVATAAGRTVRVYDAATGRPDGVIAGHADDVRAVAFGPDGKRLVTGSADKTAKVWALKD